MSNLSSHPPLIEILSPTAGFDGDLASLEAFADPDYIFLHTLLPTNSTFASIAEKGMDWFDAAHRPLLITHPCMAQGDSENSFKSCNETCNDPEQLFASWQTLSACLSLASLSLATSIYPGIDEQVDGQITLALSRVSLGGNITEDFDAMGVLNATETRGRASCKSNSMGGCDAEFESGVWFSGFDNDDPSPHFLPEYCDNMEAIANIDIAGPGILLSYLIQSAVAVFLWLIVRSAAFGRLQKRDCSSGLSAQLYRLRQSNFFYSTASFVADFHEAQCYFIIAVSIALIRASTQSAGFNGADNWNSLVYSRSCVEITAVAGVVPVVLTQFTLSYLGMDSVYSLLCLTLTLVMSVVGVLQPGNLTASRVYQMFSDHEGLDECGGHPSLRTYCKNYDGIGSTWAKLAILPCFIPTGIFWCLKIRTLDSERKTVSRLRRSTKVKLHVLSHPWAKGASLMWDKAIHTPWLRSTTRFITKGILVIANLGLFGLMGCVLAALILLQNQAAFDLDQGGWNVGQVIAVLVWAPVIARYLYTVFFGIQRGFSIRLVNEFSVVKRQNTPSRLPEHQQDEVELQSLRQETTTAAPEVPSIRDTRMGSEERFLPNNDAADSRVSPA